MLRELYKNEFFITFFSKKLAIFLVIFLANFAAFQSFATEEFLPKEQEARAHNLFLQVKCLVCKGQVIENSDAQIAYDLRQLIRAKISEGVTDEEIKDFLVENYGPEILTSPPLNRETFFLWLAPIIFLIAGILVLLIFGK